jgi:hypothetical protein
MSTFSSFPAPFTTPLFPATPGGGSNRSLNPAQLSLTIPVLHLATALQPPLRDPDHKAALKHKGHAADPDLDQPQHLIARLVERHRVQPRGCSSHYAGWRPQAGSRLCRRPSRCTARGQCCAIRNKRMFCILKKTFKTRFL